MIRRAAVAFSLLALAQPARAGLDVERLLEAIRDAENSAVHRVGAAGERGDWQQLGSVWRQYSGAPFEWASRPGEPFAAERRRVARAHAEWIIERLPRLGLAETAYSVGIVWNAGYGTVRGRKLKERHRDYARRVQALYDERGRVDMLQRQGQNPAPWGFVPTFNCSKSITLFSSSRWTRRFRAETFFAGITSKRRAAAT